MSVARGNAGVRSAARVVLRVTAAIVLLGVCAWGEEARGPQVIVSAQKTTGEPVSPHVNFVRTDPAPEEGQESTSPGSSQEPIAAYNTVALKVTYSGYPPGRYTVSWSEGAEGLVSAMAPVTVDVKSEGPPIVVVFKVQDGGAFAGRVTDAATHEPVAGISMNAANVTGKESTLYATTDADGRYRITGAIAGTYKVRAAHSGCYLPVKGADERQVETAPGTTAEGIDFVMSRMLVVRGRVLDKEGRPLPDARVVGEAPYAKIRWHCFEGRTDEDGAFEVYCTKPVDGLFVMACNSSLCVRPIGPFKVTEEGLSGLELRAEEPAVISGVVADSSGKPAPLGTTVTLSWMGACTRTQSTITNRVGVFSFESVLAGKHVLNAELARVDGGYGLPLLRAIPIQVSVASGQKAEGLKLRVPDTCALWGTVRDAAGKPVEGVRIKTKPWSEHRDRMVVWDERGGVLTDREGRYRIEGLESGPYELAVSDDSERYRPIHRAPVAAGIADIDFTLQEAHYIEGRVVCAENGQPVTEFRLVLYQKRLKQKNPISAYQEAKHVTDAEGRFKVLLDFEGTKETTLAACGPGYTTEQVWVPDVSAERGQTGVVLKLRRAGTITGIVLDPEGRPMPEARLFRGEGVFERDLMHGCVVARPDGTFELKDLDPEPQKVTVFSPGCAPTVVDVCPDPDRVKSMEIRLKRGAVVTGFFSVMGRPLATREYVQLWVDYTPEAALRSADYWESRFHGYDDLNGSGLASYWFDHPLPSGHAWVTASFHDENSRGMGYVQREVDLKDGEPMQVDLGLPEGVCVMEGTVLVPEGVQGVAAKFVVSTKAGTVLFARAVTPGAYRVEGLQEGVGEVSFFGMNSTENRIVRTMPVRLTAGTPCRLDVDLR